ncbi:MAG: exopolysaccharide biosynthesis protein [Balneolaceae bacterium]
MNIKSNQNSITGILREIKVSADAGNEVSVRDILDIVGRRSFGPVLLLAGLVIIAPLIGDIPGVPTIMATIVFLVALQLLLGQKKLWLPNFLLKRSADKKKLFNAIDKLEKPSAYVDKLIKPRIRYLTNGWMIYPVALICLLISFAIPFMEFIPFSANFAGAALTAFGLSLIAKDGLLALFGYIFTISIVVFIIYMV